VIDLITNVSPRPAVIAFTTAILLELTPKITVRSRQTVGSVRAKLLRTELREPARRDNGMRAKPLALASLIGRKVQVRP
jgi:hypothetical protein